MSHTSAAWSWVGVSALAVSVFAVTATEMMPVGLLPAMAADLAVSDGSIGLSLTFYGVVAGLLAPIGTSWTRRIDRRTLVLVIVATFVVGNAATAMVTTYGQLVLVRLLVGVQHGVMWSIIAGIAVRLVPQASAGRATALTFSGISLALVLGVPAGTALGSWIGWRSAFVALAVITAMAWGAVLVSVPRLPSTTTLRCADLPALIRTSGLAGALVVTAIVVIANYSAYAYISPFLTGQVGIDSSAVGVYLLTYGVAGVAGNVVAGGFVTRARDGCGLRRVLVGGIGLMTVALAAVLLPLGPNSAIAMVAIWGFSYSALPVMLQSVVFRIAPRAKDAATSLYVLMFNVSIAVGTGIGAVGVDLSGASTPLVIGAFAAAVGCGTAARMRCARSPADHAVESSGS